MLPLALLIYHDVSPPPPGFPPMPPFAPPGMVPAGMPPGVPPPGAIRPPFPPAPTFVPQQQGSASPYPPPPPTNGSMTSVPSASSSVPVTPPPPTPSSQAPSTPHMPVLPVPALKQVLPPFKKETDLKFQDPNFSPVSAFSMFQLILFDDTIMYRMSCAHTIRSTTLLNLLIKLSRAKSRGAKRGHVLRISCDQSLKEDMMKRETI
ncbi:uncharacterized protein EV420DRAFT_69411 [Desarmillaria tabescens]|uniref:Uncharacterized protein n=1 Tax=Armillaria tabescens TaxID=1929756 RepID=A0AA39U3A7_ARMTA|nr:uncharacterized protein EV420DRAFT_69411 [Desarmillaria tabescens]KAK0469829.1 hypothetical protein EV420DRAFT_69411 [Desarmillaria tabescens]